MTSDELPQARIDVNMAPASGVNTYTAVPGSIEYRRTDSGLRKVRNLGVGKMVLTLDRESGELLAIHSFVRTARWKTEGVGPPPEPDVEGTLFISYPFGQEDFAYLNITPSFRFNEEKRSLRITLSEGAALAIKAADCLLVGLDRKGRLTDIWMLDVMFQSG